LHCWESYEICYKTRTAIMPISPQACWYTTLENLKFCRYTANMEENANKLHFECTDFNSSTRVTVYAERIYVLTE